MPATRQPADATAEGAVTVVRVPRRRPLRTARDVQRELARCYWELREGRLDPGIAGKCAFILLGLVRVIEGTDLEARLTALETDARIADAHPGA